MSRPTVGSVPRIVLASGSPRRREFLSGLDLAFEVIPANIDETRLDDEDPDVYVARLCNAKAAHVASFVNDDSAVVIAADTTVAIDGRVLEKPTDAADAITMLRLLSGRTHLALTGVAVWFAGRSLHTVVSTEVEFAELSDDEVHWYVGTGEGLDKAGGYGLQGRAAVFIRRLNGSVSNVIGLPLAELAELLERQGVPLGTLRSAP